MKLPGVRKWGLNSNGESYAHYDNGVGYFESFMFMSSKNGCKESRSTLPTKSQTDRGLFGSLEIVWKISGTQVLKSSILFWFKWKEIEGFFFLKVREI